MCGIAGILLKNPDDSIVSRIRMMNQCMTHRGPDGDGFLLSDYQFSAPYKGLSGVTASQKYPHLPSSPLPDSAKVNLAFTHRRLSIIDISESGHQPMCDWDKKIWITFNGEIYNYIELRNELLASGHRFYSQSDTEVILQCYLKWGEACVEKFNGMWSFCIYDSIRQVCFLSRDRTGVKPLYYVHTSAFFVFASEQKALIKSGYVNPEAHPEALTNYLISSKIDQGDIQFFKGIEELPPAHSVIIDLQSFELKQYKYYELNERIDGSKTYSDWVNETRSQVESSIALRLRSDVPVGTCLSGGIDSSLILSTMHRLQAAPIHAFTASFPHTSADETKFAHIAAKHTGAIHHTVTPTLEDLLNEVDSLIFSQDTPIWDPSTFAQHSVMKQVKQHGIKVVLDGQGADELFAGYHHYYVAMWREMWQSAQIGPLVTSLVKSSITIRYPLYFLMKEMLKPRSILLKRQALVLLKEEYLPTHLLQQAPFNQLNQSQINDIHYTRLRPFLKCEDRASMWHSVESRTPFSDDPNLINFAFTIPGIMKIKDGVSKSILRDAFADVLPRQILERYDKKGFETPASIWLKGLRGSMIESIKDANLPMVDLKKLNGYTGGNDKLLFRLFVYSRWLKVFRNP